MAMAGRARESRRRILFGERTRKRCGERLQRSGARFRAACEAHDRRMGFVERMRRLLLERLQQQPITVRHDVQLQWHAQGGGVHLAYERRAPHHRPLQLAPERGIGREHGIVPDRGAEQVRARTPRKLDGPAIDGRDAPVAIDDADHAGKRLDQVVGLAGGSVRRTWLKER